MPSDAVDTIAAIPDVLEAADYRKWVCTPDPRYGDCLYTAMTFSVGLFLNALDFLLWMAFLSSAPTGPITCLFPIQLSIDQSAC